MIGVRAHEHVAMEGAQRGEAADIVFRNLRIVFVADQVISTRFHTHATDDYDIIRLTAILHGCGPAGAALGVAGGQVRHQGCLSELDRIPVVENLVDGMWLAPWL